MGRVSGNRGETVESAQIQRARNPPHRARDLGGGQQSRGKKAKKKHGALRQEKAASGERRMSRRGFGERKKRSRRKKTKRECGSGSGTEPRSAVEDVFWGRRQAIEKKKTMREGSRRRKCRLVRYGLVCLGACGRGVWRRRASLASSVATFGTAPGLWTTGTSSQRSERQREAAAHVTAGNARSRNGCRSASEKGG